MTVLIDKYDTLYQMKTGELAVVLDQESGEVKLCEPVDSYWRVVKYAEPGATTSLLKQLALELGEVILCMRRHAQNQCCECGSPDHECGQCQEPDRCIECDGALPPALTYYTEEGFGPYCGGCYQIAITQEDAAIGTAILAGRL